MGIVQIFREGTTIFGHLFFMLFLTALAVISLVIYDTLCKFWKEPVGKWMPRIIDKLCTLAALLGSLQTIISLCIVGFSLWMGTIQVGTKAFAILIQGFSSTGFGIAVAILGRSYLMISTKGKTTNEIVKVIYLPARRRSNSNTGVVDKRES